LFDIIHEGIEMNFDRNGIQILSYKKADIRINKKDIWAKTSGKCFYCGKQLQLDFPHRKNYMTIDHVIPVSKNGSHTLKNKVPACKRCNFEKGNKYLIIEDE